MIDLSAFIFYFSSENTEMNLAVIIKNIYSLRGFLRFVLFFEQKYFSSNFTVNKNLKTNLFYSNVLW